MATRFESLDLVDRSLFGIRIHGAFGRGDRQRLLDFASRCLEKDKTRLIFECGDLDSLGGGGAAVLADLQGQLVERGGEAVFVGAGEVIQRFLAKKFDELPLRFFDDLDGAAAALSPGATSSAARVAAATEEPEETTEDASDAGGGGSLDQLLDDVDGDAAEPDAHTRRAADLVTAAYVSVDDTLLAAGPEGNPAVLGEALAVLLDSHDLAAETVYFGAQGDQYVSGDGTLRLPVEGGIAETLLRTKRPLTLLDVEEGGLWDEESQVLEDLQPDLIMPLFRGVALEGVAFLYHSGEDREYGLCEVFALELLQRILSDAGREPATPTDPEQRPVTVPAPASGNANLLNAKLELSRGLQDAQDEPHFWQVFISRLRLAAEVTSLIYLDTEDPDGKPFLAGEIRRDPGDADLRSERITTFFRTLERPVEIANMPASFQAVRDSLLERGLQWIVGLRADDQVHLGMVALGLKWRGQQGEPSDEIHEFMEITGEALLRLREGQCRADMSLELLEILLVGEDRADHEPDRVTQETAAAVRLLSRELGLPPDQERDLVLGALLRNHGQDQPAIDDLTADRLTGDDWERFRAHPDAGLARVSDLNAPAAVRDAVRHHHERFDGRGFPLGLKARDIPLVARLVAVAQLYAQHQVRGGPAKALAAVHQEAGESLDPDLVDIFAKSLQRTEPVPVPA